MALLQGASASSSPSSSSSPPWRHQVFLSFRGEDTRNNFTSHLYHALNRKGIHTFIDNNLERGEEINSALSETIEGSEISIIILSPNYASSTWCLEELMKILACMETKQQIVLPVFYHVDPSDVRHQRNTFEEAFAEHADRFKDDKEKVQGWKAALTKVSNLSGFPLMKDGNEYEFINKIIQWVDKSITHTSKYPVGIQYYVQRIRSIRMNDILEVGILGTSEIGKLLISKVIYDVIACGFKATVNFRETSAEEREATVSVRETSAKERGPVKLQETYNHSELQAHITERGRGSSRNTKEGWDKSKAKGCKISCPYCKQEGHMKQNCQKLKAKKEKSSKALLIIDDSDVV